MIEKLTAQKEGADRTSRRGFLKSVTLFTAGSIATTAVGLARDEIVDWGKEAAIDLFTEPTAPPPSPGYAISPRTMPAFMRQAADYQLAGLEAWQIGRPMNDLPGICRDRSTKTFKGPQGLRFVKSIGGGLRLWGSEIEGRPLVEAFDAAYGRWCAGRLNKCMLEQEPVAEAVAAVFRLKDGTTIDATYLSLQLPYPNGDVVSISRPINVRIA